MAGEYPDSTNHTSKSSSSTPSTSSPLSSSTYDIPATASSSTSSVDQLPPSLVAGEHRATPALDSNLYNGQESMISTQPGFVLDDDMFFEDTHQQQQQSRHYSDDDSRSASPLPTKPTASESSLESESVSTPALPSSGTNLSVYDGTQARASLITSTPEETNITHRFEPRSSSSSGLVSPSFAPTTSTTPLTGFFTAPPPMNPNSVRPDNHHIPPPFSFFATTAFTSQDEVAHPKPNTHIKTLRIELAQTELVLMAGKPTVLEGVLYVTLQKNTKVKSLQLEFSGRSSVTWIDDNAYSPATRHTTAPHIEHTWPIISPAHKKSSTVLLAGQHAYPFSLELPDTLPESLSTSHGKVSYRLLATLTKPGITFNSSSATATVQILRRHAASMPASRIYHRGGRIVSSPEDKVQYKITLPQIRVPHSTKIPLQVSITSPNSRTHVTVLQVGLWERVVYRAEGRKRVDMRLVKIQKSEGWTLDDRELSTEAVTWNKVLLFDMPQMGPEMNQCNPSADIGLMKVNHILRFSILGTDGIKRFRIENEMDLKVLAMEDEYPPEEGAGESLGDQMNELPSYLTSFSTPRVSFDSERGMDPEDDDLFRALVARIHLPTYAESEEDINSRNPSRDVSRSVSRSVSQVPSRCASPEYPVLSSQSSGGSGSSGALHHTDDYASIPPPPPIHHPRAISPSERSRYLDPHPRFPSHQLYPPVQI
ncbi:hypothetical protein BX616_010996 [Lobosporangium transversale]|uniref:Or S-antigen, N-terminal domain-domain-containing protein n=1 Tax=Lobosporangium transversale TaxID=64571 RepID=A0A1Y2GXU6_9FUNG|nr:or S-antigen, N-terminal domain-domain-containing protein [Lobosporangium transversale]KAF9910014.1 hypothetical protein BX616_010996 [Lobosporangium transversale]ORZ22853.1 or S-antigen, N-terminal domain-domain-containing protein [Lobosporangium transversale]|eukprot:XP_021883407.1 or S-antigen, N-terminal domain-domain-containing protein [Lobosporangium transversale]